MKTESEKNLFSVGMNSRKENAFGKILKVT